MTTKKEDYTICITLLRTVKASSKSEAMKIALEDISIPDDVKPIVEVDKVEAWTSALVKG